MRQNVKLIGIFVIIMVIIVAIAILSIDSEDKQEGITTQNNSGVKIIAQNLDIPWDLAFLPNGDMLVTERSGNLLRIGQDKEKIAIDGVHHRGEGGLLGIALDPDFANNNFIYIYFTSQIEGEVENRIKRYTFKQDTNTLEDEKLILGGIPGASYHDGGRMEFGEDGYLYITTGDATQENLAQDLTSLAGKILRVNRDGTAAADNPFGNEIYSYGHRNPQGLTWDSEGQLWATEHGRSGVQSGFDELNKIEKGANYGWPIIEGDEREENMESPVIHSSSQITWAPAGTAFYNGSIFFTGLRGETLYQYKVRDQSLHEYLKGEFGRLRTIIIHNNSMYITTSNRDGRGNTDENDDKVIKIPTSEFSY